MPRKITAFKVVAGSYEDVEVLGVFETKPDAERFADKHARKHGHRYSHADDMPRVEPVDFYPGKGA